MKEILLTLSLLSIKLGDNQFNEKQLKENWIGFEPASVEEIEIAQRKLNVVLPSDYIELLKISNGFSAPNQIEPSFMKVQEIDYLKNIDPFLVDIWSEPALWDIGEQLKRSIIVGGKDEEQYFLLIPPLEKNGKWKYWTFASWMPGEHEHSDLKNYFQSVLEFNKTELEK